MSNITTILGLAGGAVALVVITVTVTVHYVQPPQQEAVVQQVLEPKVLSCEEVQVFVNRFGKFEFKELPPKVTEEIGNCSAALHLSTIRLFYIT